jgi:hypothetical protein
MDQIFLENIGLYSISIRALYLEIWLPEWFVMIAREIFRSKKNNTIAGVVWTLLLPVSEMCSTKNPVQRPFLPIKTLGSRIQLVVHTVLYIL